MCVELLCHRRQIEWRREPAFVGLCCFQGERSHQHPTVITAGGQRLGRAHADPLGSLPRGSIHGCQDVVALQPGVGEQDGRSWADASSTGGHARCVSWSGLRDYTVQQEDALRQGHSRATSDRARHRGKYSMCAEGQRGGTHISDSCSALREYGDATSAATATHNSEDLTVSNWLACSVSDTTQRSVGFGN